MASEGLSVVVSCSHGPNLLQALANLNKPSKAVERRLSGSLQRRSPDTEIGLSPKLAQP